MRVQLPGSSLAPRTCIMCGATFLGGPNARYCPTCRIERRRETDRQHKARKRAGKSIILGQTVGRCEKCGKEFIYTAGAQKYCPECSEEAIRENDRQSGRGWLRRAVEKHGRQYADDRNADRRVGRTSCIDCGAPLEPGHGANKDYCPVCQRLHLRYARYRTECKRAAHPRKPVSYDAWKNGER